jgi:site-specific DNA-methyltransferase (adenine-specific)
MNAFTENFVTIRHGDCLDVMRGMPPASVHAVITDPPYSSGTRREASKGLRKSMNRESTAAEWFGSDSLTTNGFAFLIRACALEWNRLLVDGGHALVFIDWRMMPTAAAAIESADLRHAGLLVWDKVGIGMGACFRNRHELILHFTKGVGRGPNRRDVANVLAFPRVRDGLHPTEKPLALIETLVDVVTHEGDTILDPFGGSGTTALAARNLRRGAWLIEREAAYCEIAAKRLGQGVLL